MRADIHRCDPRQFLDERPHFLGPQGAIDADAQQGYMGDGVPEAFHRLTGHAAVAAGLNECDGRHDRHAPPSGSEYVLNGKEGRLRVERVENGFDQQEVRSPVQESANLIAVGTNKLLVGRAPRGGIVDVRGDGRRLGGRPDRAGDETAPRRIGRLNRFHGTLGADRTGAG